MNGFNLSDWALKHRSFVIYFMIAVVVARLSSYLRLGRNEDPALHFPHHGRAGGLARRDARRNAETGDRAARAQAAGDNKPRFHPKLYDRRPHDDFRQSERRDLARASAGHLVPGPQEHRRYAPHACRRASSAPASTTISATLTALSTASPRTDSPIANCAIMSRTFARDCCNVPDVSKIEDSRRAGRADLRRVLDPAARRTGHRPRRADRRASGAERRHSRPASFRRATRSCRSASPAPSNPKTTFWRSIFRSTAG